MKYQTITNETGATERAVFYWLCGSHEDTGKFSETLKHRLPEQTWTLYACRVEDWNCDLSPWPVRNVDKLGDFAGEGRRTLAELVHIVHETQSETVEESAVRRFVGGYSLAGLFALWALYETELFDGAASCSGSLWFPGWREYATARSLPRRVSVYLSLGRREPQTKHPLMTRVGEETQRQYERLQCDPNAENIAFHWNDGGHFSDPAGRMAAGFAWLAKENRGHDLIEKDDRGKTENDP